MIALCTEHHKQADAGTWTREQLIAMKIGASQRSLVVSSKFNWMRNELVAVIGSNLFHETKTLLKWRGRPVIWFSRDEVGHCLLNVQMLTTAREKRLIIADHGWSLHGDAEDVECPPSGRLLSVKYPNGDAVKVEFYEVGSSDEMRKRMERQYVPGALDLVFANGGVTACEIHYAVGGTPIKFGPREMALPGSNFSGCMFSHGEVAINLS